MKAMFRPRGIITIIFSVLIIFAIYYVFNPNQKTYIVIGDFYAEGKTDKDYNYGYKDYLSKRLTQEHKLKDYDDTYVKNKYTIKKLKEDIKNNDYIIHNKTVISIKRNLREADILTISLGLNDMLDKLDIDDIEELETVEDKQVSKALQEIEIEYKELIKEIKKYTKKQIIIVPYSFPKNIYYPQTYKRINNLNKVLEKISKSQNVSYIKPIITKETNTNIYPTYKIYKLIALKIYQIL